jgi:Bacterial TSP3 repeat
MAAGRRAGSAVEDYGQSAGGAPGTIRGAHYEILAAGGGGMEPLPPNLRTNLRDADGDRLDDAFEQRAFNSLANTFDDDTDGDGFFNGEEYFLLTDPNSAVSKPDGVTTTPRNITVTQEAGGLCVCWDGRPDANYTVMESSNLEMNAWLESAQTGMQIAPGRFQWTNPGTAARLFVRIVTEFE